MSKLNISRLTNENEDGAPRISGITTFSTTAFLEVPKGTTAQRPEFVQPGMIRFNTDGAHLEYYNGVEWTEVLVANNTLDGGARGLFAGGYVSPVTYNVIDYIVVDTLGNAQDFGDLSSSKRSSGSASSSTRALWGGGFPQTNVIDYITISSIGNAQDFGDLTQFRFHPSGCSSSTRGLFGGGVANNPGATWYNIIDYVTIASIGNAVDYGDLSVARQSIGSFSSSTRGIFAGGINPTINTIDFVTISTTANSQDFGDLTFARGEVAGCSNSTRGLIGGGTPSTNIIDYVTIASTGNAQDFGDLISTTESLAGCSSPTRGVFGGGFTPSLINVIQYVTILSTGNAVDFGDLSISRGLLSACSNGHGGL
jgi:hypothetical protein